MRFLRFLNKRPRRRTPKSPPSRRALLRVEQLEGRVVPYATSGNAWPNPQVVSISFVPDGTDLGGVSSNLFATFNARWSTATWEAQILKAAQVWAQQTNINFTVISDNGGAIGSGNYQQGDPNMGDIRIGGYNFGTCTLASTYMPPSVNNYSIAGDIQFNTGQTFNIGSTYDLFTVAAHEFGHALGLEHSTNSYAVMYASYTSKKTALVSDDINGIRAIYSSGSARSYDSYYGGSTPNNSFTNAANISSLIDPTALTAVVNNLDITTTSETEYFTFTAPSGTNSTITVGVQSTGLSLLEPTLTVYACNHTTVLGTVSGTSNTGNTLTLTLNNVTAGEQFYIKMAGQNTTAFGTGDYALVLNLGTGSAPTVTLPNTQDLAGSPPSSGGGVSEVPSASVNSPGHDTFGGVDVGRVAVVAGTAGATTISAVPHNSTAPGTFDLIRALAAVGEATGAAPAAAGSAVAAASSTADAALASTNNRIATAPLSIAGSAVRVDDQGEAGANFTGEEAQPVQGAPPAEVNDLPVTPANVAPVRGTHAGFPLPGACDACFADRLLTMSTARSVSEELAQDFTGGEAWLAEMALAMGLAGLSGGFWTSRSEELDWRGRRPVRA
jgi:hypothetical protein